MTYILVDELRGVGGSRKVFESFGKFTDLKEWLIHNTGDLYGYIPCMTSDKLPNFKECSTVNDLNEVMKTYTYANWRLRVITAHNTLGNTDWCVARSRRMMWATMKPLVDFENKTSTTNGVKWSYLQNLNEDVFDIVAHATASRVITRTKYVVLVEWLGSKGTVTTWVQYRHLENKFSRKTRERVYQ